MFAEAIIALTLLVAAAVAAEEALPIITPCQKNITLINAQSQATSLLPQLTVGSCLPNVLYGSFGRRIINKL
jgi:hypothetical protein